MFIQSGVLVAGSYAPEHGGPGALDTELRRALHQAIVLLEQRDRDEK